eukprot:m.184962 g.184962  ORF g.184962 m.184962 type:complete len:200 (+) comp15022_c0_seq2:621-1220(+)
MEGWPSGSGWHRAVSASPSSTSSPAPKPSGLPTLLFDAPVDITISLSLSASFKVFDFSFALDISFRSLQPRAACCSDVVDWPESGMCAVNLCELMKMMMTVTTDGQLAADTRCRCKPHGDYACSSSPPTGRTANTRGSSPGTVAFTASTSTSTPPRTAVNAGGMGRIKGLWHATTSAQPPTRTPLNQAVTDSAPPALRR